MSNPLPPQLVLDCAAPVGRRGLVPARLVRLALGLAAVTAVVWYLAR